MCVCSQISQVFFCPTFPSLCFEGEAPQQSDAAPSDTASAASMSTMSTARLIEQGKLMSWDRLG